MRYLVTGCAGFIGSNLTDRLLQDGHEVIGYDNLSTGKKKYLLNAFKSANFTFIQSDLDATEKLTAVLKNVDAVFHLAANADVRFGLDHPDRDLKQNTLNTFYLLEAMRINKIPKIIFASTGSIYGECPIIPTPEDAPFPIQTSLYGASKLAAEGLIQAYCAGFDLQCYIFRFVSILGERYHHGHLYDFYRQLLANPAELKILGDGQQKKSYLYIQDCLDGIFLALNLANDKINIFNLGTNEYCKVDNSIDWLCDYLKLTPQRIYAGGERGWVGDNPFIFLDCSKIKKLGWEPKLSIQESVIRTLDFFQQNSWVLTKE
jgi:UDP-glucose 4-epimerase